MISQVHIPRYPLNQFIDFFYYYAGFNPTHEIDRFLPDGNIQLIFDFTDYPKYIYDNNTLEAIQACEKVWFSGFRTQPITIPSGRESEMLIVQFRKGKAYPFICCPVSELKNLVVDAEQLLSPAILDIRECMGEALTCSDKFEVLENGLIRLFLNRFNHQPLLDFAISEIMESPEQSRIKEITDCSGYSQKHMIAMFKKHVGVTPKEFLRVIRFQQTIRQIELSQEVS